MKRFKQLLLNGVCFSFFALLILITGCQEDVYNPDNNNNPPPHPSKDSYFDFSTTTTLKMEINYCMDNFRVMFELYSESPVDVLGDGSTRKNENKPFYRATTDIDGAFYGEIMIPTSIEKVYLYCGYLGTIECAELEIENSRIWFNQNSYLKEIQTKGGVVTRASTDDGHTIPDGYKVLGGWNNIGTPNYLAEKRWLNDDFRYRITSTFLEKEVKNDPTYVGEQRSMDIHLIKKTKVYLVFLESTGDFRNVVGYFTYPTNNPPQSPEQIDSPVIAFPSISKVTQREIGMGDQVQLKYWNGTEFEDEFPAGTSIGWFLMSDGFKNGDIKPMRGNAVDDKYVANDVDYIFYSNRNLNQKRGVGQDLQRTVAAYDGDRMIVLCFEDFPSVGLNHEWWNFRDALLYIHIEESEAIDDTNIPELPKEEDSKPTEENNTVTYTGSLAFEDNWPYQGDYDMNDMVIHYESVVYKDLNNKVIKIVDRYKRAGYSAGFTNGFGYELTNISTSDISSLTGDVTSLESGQAKPVIIVNKDMRQTTKLDYEITLNFRNPIEESKVMPPYNPFIIIQSNKGRGTEMHLTKLSPTSLMNFTLFGTNDDESRPDDDLYYVSGNSYPFAIHIPGVEFYGAPEGVRIDEAYPDFSKWAASKGRSNTTWYRK